jgi:hypothetical protein
MECPKILTFEETVPIWARHFDSENVRIGNATKTNPRLRVTSAGPFGRKCTISGTKQTWDLAVAGILELWDQIQHAYPKWATCMLQAVLRLPELVIKAFDREIGQEHEVLPVGSRMSLLVVKPVACRNMRKVEERHWTVHESCAPHLSISPVEQHAMRKLARSQTSFRGAEQQAEPMLSMRLLTLQAGRSYIRAKNGLARVWINNSLAGPRSNASTAASLFT